jgi:nitroreductase
MSANSIPQVEGAAQRSTGFDPAFRARLRELLIWRRDVRRFRCDPLPSGTLESLIELACLAPSVGLSQPWRFVIVENTAARAAIRQNFATCNALALAAQSGDRAGLYAQLKLAGLDEAPCHLAVFADRATTQGHGLGRHTMPEMIDYSAVTAAFANVRHSPALTSNIDHFSSFKQSTLIELAGAVPNQGIFAGIGLAPCRLTLGACPGTGLPRTCASLVKNGAGRLHCSGGASGRVWC